MLSTKRIETYVFISSCLLFCLGVALSFYNDPLFKSQYVVEDGFIEWLTVIGLLASMLLCGNRYVRLRNKRNIMFTVILGLLTLFFAFGAGEEISWGQRIFNIQSPEFFQQNNYQSETNLHNLMVNGVKINKLIFGLGLGLVLLTYLCVITPLYHYNKLARHYINKFGIPIPRRQHILAYFVLLAIVELIMVSSKKGELTEFMGSFIVFLNLLNPHNVEIYDPQKHPHD